MCISRIDRTHLWANKPGRFLNDTSAEATDEVCRIITQELFSWSESYFLVWANSQFIFIKNIKPKSIIENNKKNIAEEKTNILIPKIPSMKKSYEKNLFLNM